MRWSTLVALTATGAALLDFLHDPCLAGEIEAQATLRANYGNVLAVAFSPDGRTVACGCGKDLWDSYGEVQLWDASTGKLRSTLKGHAGGVTSVAFTEAGKTLVSGSYDATVKLWDLETGTSRTTLKKDWRPSAVACLALTQDAKLLAIADWVLRLLEVATGKPRASFEWRAEGSHEDSVTSVAFSPDDRLLASASWDGTVKLWDVRGVKASGDLDDLHVLPESKKPRDNRAARLQLTLKGPIAQVWSVAFAPDGKTLAAAYEDGTVTLWNPETSKEQASFRHSAAVKSVSFSPNSQTLAAGCEDGTVRLEDIATGKERATLTGHSGPVLGLAFSPDGWLLATGGGQELKLWDMSLNKE